MLTFYYFYGFAVGDSCALGSHFLSTAYHLAWAVEILKILRRLPSLVLLGASRVIKFFHLILSYGLLGLRSGR